MRCYEAICSHSKTHSSFLCSNHPKKNSFLCSMWVVETRIPISCTLVVFFCLKLKMRWCKSCCRIFFAWKRLTRQTVMVELLILDLKSSHLSPFRCAESSFVLFFPILEGNVVYWWEIICQINSYVIGHNLPFLF